MGTQKSNQRIRQIPSALEADIDAFLTDRQARNLSPRSIAWYAEKLAVAGTRLAQDGVDDVADLTPAHLRRLVLDYAKDHRPGGVHGIYRAVRCFLNWWGDEYEPANWRNPIRKVPLPRVPEGILDPVDRSASSIMLAVCMAHSAVRCTRLLGRD